jgi:hypothetical protein
MTRALDRDTPWAEGIRKLEERAGSVPDGWLRPYADTLAKLYAVSSAEREHIRLDGPLTADRHLYLTHHGGDSVVTGILGRLERMTAQTCECCSRPGTLRIYGDRMKILCPACAAPILALDAISDLLDDLDSVDQISIDQPILFDDLPVQIRPMLSAECWDPVYRRSIGRSQRHELNRVRLLAQRPRLEAIRRELVGRLHIACES